MNTEVAQNPTFSSHIWKRIEVLGNGETHVQLIRGAPPFVKSFSV